MHVLKCRINCTRTRIQLGAVRDELRAVELNYANEEAHMGDVYGAMLRLGMQAANGADDSLDCQGMRASKLYVNLSHAWFLNYG